MITELKELVYDDNAHSYQVEGQFLPSVTTLLKRVEEGFNASEKSEEMEKKGKGNAEELRKKWKAKADNSIVIGKAIHKFAEDYLDSPRIPQNQYESNLLKSLEKLIKTNEPLAKEFKMYSAKYKFAGTTDLILRDGDSKNLIVVDYKTNEDLFKNFRGKTLLDPFEFLLDTPFNKYQLQLSLYQLILEELGFNVTKRYIIWCNDKVSEIYPTANFTKQLGKWLQSL